MNTLTAHTNTLAERVLAKESDRMLVAITGAPGCGKSTLASELARRLNAQGRKAIVVPMDGFHLDNMILEARGLRPRKGAPETFDAPGFLRLIHALKTGEEVFAPSFDRTRDLAIAGSVAVPAATKVVIVEGNYLMFDEPPWSALAGLWDLSVRVNVPMPELRARLIHRWLSLNYSSAVATRRAEGNDIPNAQRVIDRALPCDVDLNGEPARSS
ncbi:nucleoside/nucleotide kinase family protein [Roseobacter sp. CCS2]|uniref:nucleoside/nucleotide kinase family protein n=1 Tax=Roseobacter sp. CCS2 TaxID=391593 RepID=UPI0000F3FDBB|nr:nucleoside/nucleotide kinase family protein [Roseobacter sp. CCS2]EBA10667.1 putative fructose transport system kinase [Roseobacter sp. CCS2]